jgi:hypothetical protein
MGIEGQFLLQIRGGATEKGESIKFLKQVRFQRAGYEGGDFSQTPLFPLLELEMNISHLRLLVKNMIAINKFY